MPYTAPNATPYESNTFPISTRILAVKRGDGTTAGGGTATSVGSYLAENCAISRTSTVVDRRGIYGEGKGEPVIIRQPLSWTSKVQIDLTTSNTIRPGDYFEEIIDVDTGTSSTNKVRFIIHACNKDETAGNPHTFNLDSVEDMVHSSQYGGS